MPILPGDANWLALRAAALFELDDAGRILACRDPNIPAPRVHIQRSGSAVCLRLRHDLPATAAETVLSAAANIAPGAPRGDLTHRLDDVRGALSPIRHERSGPIYALPNGLQRQHPGEIVRSDSPAGQSLAEAWRSAGFPEALLALGFTDAGDLWAPYCLLLLDGEIAAVCQSARLTADAAEAGVITAPAHRGRGLAAAVTAAWSRHPDLAGHALIYSTSHENRSSRRVAARLGLRLVAEDVGLF